MSDLYIYLKTGEDKQALAAFAEALAGGYYDTCYTFSENRRSNVLYQKIQRTLAEGDVLVLSSLSTFGADNQAIFQELSWLKTHKVLLVVQEYPSTHTLDVNRNLTAVSVLTDVYAGMPGVKQAAFTKHAGGRRAIQYPENWDELYAEWACKKITATEFIARSGLKKGTFYTMLNEYKKMLEENGLADADAG